MTVSSDAIIIGGGPSGVAAAVELRQRGFGKIVLLDREAGLGGATRHCLHSPFGMREFGRVFFGPAYGRRLAEEAERAGVDVRLNHSVVRQDGEGGLLVSYPGGVERFESACVIHCTGARETPRSARMISGDRPVGVLTTGALQAYIAFHGTMPFRRPLIVGSELVTFSAVLSCLTHGARPVAVIEAREHALVRRPLALFPALMGIPFHRDAAITDIIGSGRVEAARVRIGGEERLIACDGVLLTGQFIPEASLILQSGLGLQAGSAGPAVDQFGRMRHSHVLAAGNVLRGVETGGWAFREGRAVARSLAERSRKVQAAAEPVEVSADDPVKLVVPGLWRNEPGQTPAFSSFQLRMKRKAKGRLSLVVNGREIWAERGTWMPERRILVPLPPSDLEVSTLHFVFAEDRA